MVSVEKDGSVVIQVSLATARKVASALALNDVIVRAGPRSMASLSPVEGVTVSAAVGVYAEAQTAQDIANLTKESFGKNVRETLNELATLGTNILKLTDPGE